MDERQASHGLIQWHGTTIIGVRKGGKTVIAGDGQVSMGNTVMKPNARKVRRIGEGEKVIAGFAGATADAFTLFERLEKKLEAHRGQLMRAAVELAKDWRTDKYLRNLEALMIVADKDVLLILTGNGDVLEPEGGVAAIGSGGNYALAAARARTPYEDDPEHIARRAMEVAAVVRVFTNDGVTVEVIWPSPLRGRGWGGGRVAALPPSQLRLASTLASLRISPLKGREQQDSHERQPHPQSHRRRARR